MDPPPPLPTIPSSTITAAAAPITATSIQLNYPDSMESSPRSRTADGYESDPLPPVPEAKLRLMCSYGGHIIPRPHDKSLCYVGGETRLVVVDRQSSLSSFSTHLSRSLLNGRHFTLKYQLPNEELDSLVSLTTDEDLENMIEEYDRLTSSSTRIRLFVFFKKPETAATMDSLLNDAKSETWFVDAINGSGLLSRGLSDTTMDNFLYVENENDLDAQIDDGNLNKRHAIKYVVAHDVQYSMPDSPVVETASSFGSSSSSLSMSNLPPIRVRVEEVEHSRQMEEQFTQMSLHPIQKPVDHGGVFVPSCGLPPPAPVGLTGRVSPSGLCGDQSTNIIISSDDERSEHGGTVAVNRLRKPPLPSQPVQQKACSAYHLPSPDSVPRDSIIASASSLSKQMYYQGQVPAAPRETRAPSPNIPNTKSDNLPPSMHYIPHPAAATPLVLPISSYYHHPIYVPPPQQQLHHPIDQLYPVYVMQPPHVSMQSHIADTSVVASSRPVNPPVYATPPVYPTKTTAASTQAKVIPEMPTGVNMTATATATAVIATPPPPPPLVQIPGSQFQQQYVAAAGYSPMQLPSQVIGTNYGYNEYAKNIPAHDQLCYTTTQPQASDPLPPPYVTMTPAVAAALADAPKQLPVDSSTTQQSRTSRTI